MATAAKLHESAGILKASLQKNKFLQVKNVVNSTWKAQVVHNGHATKLDTVRYCRDNGIKIDLLAAFGLDEAKLSIRCNKITGVKTYHVPSPIQDIADAIALAEYDDTLPRKFKKNPKPKIIIPQSQEVQDELNKLMALQKEAKKKSIWAGTETHTKPIRTRKPTIPRKLKNEKNNSLLESKSKRRKKN